MLGLHTLLTLAVTKMKLHSLQTNILKPWWLRFPFRLHFPSYSICTWKKQSTLICLILISFPCAVYVKRFVSRLSDCIFWIEGQFSFRSAISVSVRRLNERAVVSCSDDPWAVCKPFGFEKQRFLSTFLVNFTPIPKKKVGYFISCYILQRTNKNK